jgi:hypothetical protein
MVGFLTLLALLGPPPAFAEGEIAPNWSKWIELRYYRGGLTGGDQSKSEEASERAAIRAELGSTAAKPESLDAFRNAFDFAFAVHGAGGLDREARCDAECLNDKTMDHEQALEFALRVSKKGDPAAWLKNYRTAFYDGVSSGKSVDDARKVADKSADRGAAPALSEDDITRFVKWATRSPGNYGAALDTDAAKDFAKRLFSGAQTDGAQKVDAFRELYFLGCGRPPAGGMGLCSKRSGPEQALLERVLTVARLPDAWARVEAMQSAYREGLLNFPGPQKKTVDEDPAFKAFQRQLVDQLFAKAADLKVPPQEIKGLGAGGGSGARQGR